MNSVISKFNEFWRWFEVLIGDWLNTLDWSQIWLSIAIVIVVLGLRNILAHAAVRITVAVGNAIGVKIGDTIQTAITPAARALIVSLACLISLGIIGPPDLIAETIERILISVAIAAVFTATYSFTDLLADLVEPYRMTRTQIQVDWFVRLARIAVVILGFAAILKVWGIDLGPVITGMGVFGAAVALAAQDLFRNLIAGMTNMSEERFQVGDWIRVEGLIEGVVERVEFRSTTVRRFDRAPAHVPNADLANAPLINFNRMPHRRIYWMISLVYSTTTEQLAEISNVRHQRPWDRLG